MKSIYNKQFTRQPEDGLKLSGPESSNVLIQGCFFSDCPDELASVVKGATSIIFDNCHFRDNEKGVLVGTGDECDFELEKDSRVIFKNCVFDNISRRSPYFRYGSIQMLNCEIRNWQGGVKTYGSRFEDANVTLTNVHYHQDKFRWEWRQWLNGILGGHLMGCWRGIVCDGKCKITKINVTANKWWIWI